MSATPTSARNRRRGSTMGMPNPNVMPMSGRGVPGASASSRGAGESVDRGASETPSARRRRSTVMDVNSSLQTSGNSMKVYIRVRPFSERELEKKMSTHSTVRIDTENPAHITLLNPTNDFKPAETYLFTRCFWSVLEKSSGGREAEAIQQTVDTFLNGGMNNAPSARRRSRAASLMGPQPMVGGRARAMSIQVEPMAAGVPASVGSAAAMSEGAGVTHPPYAGQDEVYNYVGKPILKNTLEGYNGCIFAYGQTGSGKTFTMLGYAPDKSDIKEQRKRRESMACNTSSASAPAFTPTGFCELDEATEGEDSASNSKADFARQVSPQVIPPRGAEARAAGGAGGEEDEEDELIDEVVDYSSLDPNNLQGIIPRITTDLFIGLREKCEADPSRAYRVEVSYYEIYNEKVYDLLRPGNGAELKIRNSSTGPFIDGLSKKVAVKEEEVAKLIRKGSQERHTAATKFNDRSSRSHAILNFSIVQTYMNDTDNLCTMQSKLNLVDLAGSERTGAAGAEGSELLEGNKINQSLMVLGRVIDCLADLSQNKSLAVPVPYRHSNLTWLLSDSLGGNSRTSMIATISPHALNFDEMRQTIRYASRAKQIVQRAVVNEDPHAALVKRLNAKIASLEAIIQDSGGADYTREYVKGLEKRVRQLEKKVEEQERIIVGLRIELEIAGIPDPTLNEGDEGDPAKSPVARARADPAALDAAKREIEALRKTLDETANVSYVELEELQKNLADSSKLVDDLRAELTRRATAYDARMEWLAQCVMPLVRAKEESFLFEVDKLRTSLTTETSSLVARIQRDAEKALAEAKSNHRAEMELLGQQQEAKQRDLLAENRRVQQQLVDRHKEALASLEQRLEMNKEAYAQSKERLEKDLASFKTIAAEQTQRAREQYQQELAKLRERLESGIDSRQRTNETVQELQQLHEKEMAKVQDELESTKRAKEAEVARLKADLENQQLKNRSDALEHDRVRRSQDADIVELRRQLLMSQQERGRAEREMQDQIKDLMEQQEQLITVSNAVLADWENKSSDMEADMCSLRALIYDQDYMNARQRMHEFAFRERRDYTKDFESLDQKEKRQTEAMRVLSERLRKAKASQENTISKYALEMKQRSPRPQTASSEGSPTSLNVALE